MQPRNLVAGVDSFTLLDLFRKAAAFKGTIFQERNYTGALAIYRSEPIKVYELTYRLITLLSTHGIDRKIRENGTLASLVDTNPYPSTPGWAHSNYWNFLLPIHEKYPMTLSVNLSLSIKRRGIVFEPRASGPFVSAEDRLPNFRMFKILTDGDRHASSLAKELARSDGSIVVSWTELSLGGIRKLTDLFAEFAQGNKDVEDLGQYDRVFNPKVYGDSQRPLNEIFITEPAQPRLFELWQTQLTRYRDRLRVTV